MSEYNQLFKFVALMCSRSGYIAPMKNILHNGGKRANGSSQWRQIWCLSIFHRALPLVQIWRS